MVEILSLSLIQLLILLEDPEELLIVGSASVSEAAMVRPETSWRLRMMGKDFCC